MQIKKIKLENIRSYVNQEINFPEGSILLQGDIGSGKSSVLLAIDFALFGLRKGDLPGGALLRNGEERGSVELHFNVEGRDIVIKRNLKRNVGSISQESGYIYYEGVKREGTAVELKQKILELLNYPMDLLTKSKALIYKYTVYTPQEEMKYILTADKDTRLDTLRKVFGIDKYKRIKENAKIITTKIREKRKEMAGKIFDLEEKKKDKEEKDRKLSLVNAELFKIIPLVDEAKEKVNGLKEKVLEFENKIEDFNKLKSELGVKKIELKKSIEEIENNEKELGLLRAEIEKLERETQVEIKEIKIDDKKAEVSKVEKEMNEILMRLNGFKIKIENSENIKKSINELKVCPTCKQEVQQEHKARIIEEEDKKINEIKKNFDFYENERVIREKKLELLKKELDEFLELKNKYDIIKVKSINLDEKKRKRDFIINNQERLRKDIKVLEKEISEIEEKTKDLESVREGYYAFKERLDKANEELKDIEIKKASIENEIKNIRDVVESLEKEIGFKEKIKNNLVKLSELSEWIEMNLYSLVGDIERKVMVRIHYDFNSLFQKWFNMLVENENLKIDLDEDFTPLIEQNNHDIEYGNLSGGEKTAAALAYRLALNQVINNLVTEIKTKDLLILDEPTDGFSTDQLDRVKVVLDELNIKQIIIVSHEAKVESFVDNVINFEKKDHKSFVV
jgi:exonuclease SbcC